MGSIRNTLWKIYSRAERGILPDLINPQLLYSNLLREYIDEGAKWLDLGCGKKFFSKSIPNSDHNQIALVERGEIVAGIDLDFEAIRSNTYLKNKTVGDMGALPFRDASFDVVSANMVVEHIEAPDAVLAEIGRILSPGGMFILHTPNVLNYKVAVASLIPEAFKKRMIGFFQDRRETDVFRTYYRLNTGRRLNEAADAGGFGVVEIFFVQGPADTVMLGPLVIFELLLMKLLSGRVLAPLRSNIIAVFQKQAAP